MEKTKKRIVNWTTPTEPQNITLEEYRNEIRSAENSETMTFESFLKRQKEWEKENL